MLNFNFSEKGLGLVSPPHFMYDFSRKMFLMLHSINWANFIVWLSLLLETLSNMCINCLLTRLYRCAFHFVEMQSVFFYIFRMGWNFLIKFCSSDPSFNRNILRSLYLKFKASAHAHIVIAYYYTLFTNFLRWCEF